MKSVLDKVAAQREFKPTDAAPVKAVNEWETELFINVIIKYELSNEIHEYRPMGARLTKKEATAKPKLYEALRLIEDTSILECAYNVVKGEILKREQFKETVRTMSDDLQKLLSALEVESEGEYTNYLRIVGDMYAVSKTGKRTKINVFPPSLDFKEGNEAKELEKQKGLIAAVLMGNHVEVELESIKLNQESEQEEEEDYI